MDSWKIDAPVGSSLCTQILCLMFCCRYTSYNVRCMGEQILRRHFVSSACEEYIIIRMKSVLSKLVASRLWRLWIVEVREYSPEEHQRGQGRIWWLTRDCCFKPSPHAQVAILWCQISIELRVHYSVLCEYIWWHNQIIYVQSLVSGGLGDRAHGERIAPITGWNILWLLHSRWLPARWN